MRSVQEKHYGENNADPITNMFEEEALWVYRYQKTLHCLVDDNFPVARVEAFKDLCLKEGDYKLKDGK